MEKTALKLLKALYRVDDMKKCDIDQCTSHDPEEGENPYLAYLRKIGFIESRTVGDKIEGKEIIRGVELWSITLEGRGFIEARRKDFFMFWLPYGITTIIALAALLR